MRLKFADKHRVLGLLEKIQPHIEDLGLTKVDVLAVIKNQVGVEITEEFLMSLCRDVGLQIRFHKYTKDPIYTTTDFETLVLRLETLCKTLDAKQIIEFSDLVRRVRRLRKDRGVG